MKQFVKSKQLSIDIDDRSKLRDNKMTAGNFDLESGTTFYTNLFVNDVSNQSFMHFNVVNRLEDGTIDFHLDNMVKKAFSNPHLNSNSFRYFLTRTIYFLSCFDEIPIEISEMDKKTPEQSLKIALIHPSKLFRNNSDYFQIKEKTHNQPETKIDLKNANIYNLRLSLYDTSFEKIVTTMKNTEAGLDDTRPREETFLILTKTIEHTGWSFRDYDDNNFLKSYNANRHLKWLIFKKAIRTKLLESLNDAMIPAREYLDLPGELVVENEIDDSQIETLRTKINSGTENYNQLIMEMIKL